MNKQNKKYYPISLYLLVFSLLAILPAGLTTYLSVKSADQIQKQAEIETTKRARSELLQDVEHLAEELIGITKNLENWDETRILFTNATYYNYWKDTRIKGIAQYKGLVDALDLYTADGNALTQDFSLAEKIYAGAVSSPAMIALNGHTYII